MTASSSSGVDAINTSYVYIPNLMWDVEGMRNYRDDFESQDHKVRATLSLPIFLRKKA